MEDLHKLIRQSNLVVAELKKALSLPIKQSKSPQDKVAEKVFQPIDEIGN